MRKSIRKNIFMSIVFAFFAVIVLFVGLVVPELSNTEVVVNPTEIETTVVEVVEKERDYLITVEEYNCKLFVDSDSIIDKETLRSLSAGEKIFFKLIELNENPLGNPQIEQVFVVTLRTETQDIITLESYYKSAEQGMMNIRSLCIIVTIILGVISLINILKILNASEKVKSK